MLNFGLSKRAIDCLLDDLASGHHGTNGNNILKQLFPNARRIRIQGCCTPHIQVADTVWANFRLNKLVTDKMRKNRIKELLETGKITYLLGNSLTATGREFLGNFLSGIKNDWNTNEKLTDGVKLGFQRIYNPTAESNRPKKLQKLLSKANGDSIYAPYAAKDDKSFGTCKFGCGHVYSSRKDKNKHEKDPDNCFPRRPKLMPPPFVGQSKPGTPIGMLFKMDGGEIGVIVKNSLGM